MYLCTTMNFYVNTVLMITSCKWVAILATTARRAVFRLCYIRMISAQNSRHLLFDVARDLKTILSQFLTSKFSYHHASIHYFLFQIATSHKFTSPRSRFYWSDNRRYWLEYWLRFRSCTTFCSIACR